MMLNCQVIFNNLTDYRTFNTRVSVSRQTLVNTIASINAAQESRLKELVDAGVGSAMTGGLL